MNVSIKITENKNRRSAEFRYKEEIVTLVSSFSFMAAPNYDGNAEPIANLVKISLQEFSGTSHNTGSTK